MSEAKDTVTFKGIQRSYPPGEDMVVRYVIESGSELKKSKRDWVGLFRVGWTSSRDYYTFEWVPQPEQDEEEFSVTFAGRRLPPEDGHFYQLCFVSRDGAVRGASAPFQFAPLSVTLEDMELVEISDDSMKSVMVLQKKTNIEEVESLRRENGEAQVKLEDLRNKVTTAETENEALVGENAGLRQQIATTKRDLEAEVAALKAEVNGANVENTTLKNELEEEKRTSAEKEARIVELERQVAIKCESEMRANEQLQKEKDWNLELLSAKENEEQELKVLKERVSTVEGEVVELATENGELKEQICINESQVQDLQQLVGTRGEVVEQVTEKLENVEAENAQLHALCAELRSSLGEKESEVLQQQGSFRVDITAALSKKDEEIERLQQELACAEVNMVELMGAQKSGRNPELYHMPPCPPNMVDKGAYVALQQAHEELEKYYSEEKKLKERALAQLKNFCEENNELKVHHTEMVERVKQCQTEYTAKAKECSELQRQLKKSGMPKPSGMEVEHEEMVRNCETAVAELSLRRKETDDMKNKITTLEDQVAKQAHEFTKLEDRYDKKVAEKNEEIQRLKLVFDEKAMELAAIHEEKAQLETKVGKLTSSIKHQHTESSRTCPVCQMKIPMRMTEEEFTKHVNTHFETV